MSCRWAPDDQAGRGSGERVGHVHPRATTERRRDQVGVQDGHRPRAELEDDRLALRLRLEAERRAAPTRVPVDPVEPVLALGHRHAEQHDPAGAVATHPVDVRIIGVEDRGARPRDGLDHDALDVGQLADGVDAAQPEVVAGDVGDHRHVVAVVAEALAQDPAAGDLEDRRVDLRVLEHGLGRLRPGHVALPGQPAVDHDAVRRGHPDPPAHQLEDVRRSSGPWSSSRSCRSRR